jgi:hypothetical protein
MMPRDAEGCRFMASQPYRPIEPNSCAFEAEELRREADWRRQQAEEHPEDPKNATAAELLGKIADEVEQFAGTDIERELADLQRQAIDAAGGLASYVRTLGEYRSRVGFDQAPQTGKEYLLSLMGLVLVFLDEAGAKVRKAED